MLTMRAYAGSTLQLHVELCDIRPAIWRRLVVSAEITLDALHESLQIAFGWTSSHLHDFQIGDARFGMLDPDEEMLLIDERAAPVGAVVREGSTFLYAYDYGDDWEHLIKVENISEPSAHPIVIECTGGARACPPEDCGGAPGYDNLLRVLADPSDEEHLETKEWVGHSFNPENFDLDKVNKKLRTLAKSLERQARSRRQRRAR